MTAISLPRKTRRRRPRVSIVVGSVLVGLFVGAAIVSLIYTPHDPTALKPGLRLLSPGEDGFLLGTDRLGRDVFSQLMVAARTSLLVSLVGATAALLVGAAAGLTAAATRGMWDETVMRLADILMSVPGVVFALVLAAKIGSGVVPTVLALTIFFSPTFARLGRSAALRVLEEDFVTAARMYGRRTPFILIRHVLPNIASVLIVQFTSVFAAGILTEASLSYLGVGVKRPDISYGTLLAEAQSQVGASSLLAVWPGLAIIVAVLGLTLLGDGLRDMLDPKLDRELP